MQIPQTRGRLLSENLPSFSFRQGLLGSVAFVREYLIPKELLAKKAHFLGAYVIDMALNHDTTPGSQTLPRDLTIVS